MLKSLVNYDPVTGHFTWPDGSRADVDAKVRIRSGNYRRVYVNGKTYYAHRLAWFFVHGVWPTTIDHIDFDPSNNSIANLRECSVSQNQANKPKYSNNTTGFKGVCKHSCGKYMASIQHQSRQRYLGLHDTAEQAHAAYVAAANQLHKEFAHS